MTIRPSNDLDLKLHIGADCIAYAYRLCSTGNIITNNPTIKRGDYQISRHHVVFTSADSNRLSIIATYGGKANGKALALKDMRNIGMWRKHIRMYDYESISYISRFEAHANLNNVAQDVIGFLFRSDYSGTLHEITRILKQDPYSKSMMPIAE